VACPTGSELTTIPQHMLSYRKENALPKNKPGMGSRFRGNDVLTVADAVQLSVHPENVHLQHRFRIMKSHIVI
jgi:hypothetical protein